MSTAGIRRPLAERFWSKVVVASTPHPVLGTPCHNFTGARDRKGYGRINPGGDGGGILAHRAAYHLIAGLPLAPSDVLMHVCDNPSCVNVEHLQVGTLAENNRDCLEKGRTARGERSGSSRLSAATVRQVVSDHSSGVRAERLATEHGVAIRTIYDILQGRTWSHVTGIRHTGRLVEAK